MHFVFKVLLIHQFTIVVLWFDNNWLKYLFIFLKIQTFIYTITSDFSGLSVIIDEWNVLLFDVITVYKIVALFKTVVKQLSHRDDFIVV